MVRGELLQSHESTKLHVQKDADDLSILSDYYLILYMSIDPNNEVGMDFCKQHQKKADKSLLDEIQIWIPSNLCGSFKILFTFPV